MAYTLNSSPLNTRTLGGPKLLPSYTASLAATLDDDTAAFSAQYIAPITGSLSATLEDDSAHFTAFASDVGSYSARLNAVLDDDVASFEARISPVGGFQAALNTTLEDDTASFSAQAVPAYRISIEATLEDDIAAFSAYTMPSFRANLAATLEDDAAVFAASLPWDAFVKEEAAGSDEVWSLGYPLLTDAANATGEVFAVSVERAVLVTEQANASDRLMLGVHVPPVESVANASDEAWTGPVAVLASEVATAKDELTVSATGGVTVSDSAQAADEAWQSTVVMAESVATASDEVTANYHLMAESVALASDELTASVTAYALAESQANAEDDLWAVVQSLQIVTVVAEAIDQVLMPDQYAMAMVMNVETGAPYLYDNFPLMAAAQADERIFAIGPDGLYQLSGDDDAGFAIDAHVELPGLSLGQPDNRGQLSRSPERKRVNSVWLDCEADTAMTLEVESYDQGMLKQQYQAIQALDHEGNMKVDVGKGLKSKWWGMTIRNTNGGDFTLLGASADVLSTARRR